ncbi:uncharacterized protein LOC132736154 isoform X2 [Ruditapes philippinarum]|uniref:uncharacterized protein LOC132736154 isoform X2 n=1 Tax=Ruditapes philippinarum TaxID=129788 RepID=UPI00295B6427|nr:uncharacterized protein LOC132736154 isoform X2 [Ruditapes philippinarum]
MRRYIPVVILNAMLLLAVIYILAPKEETRVHFGKEQEILNLTSDITIMEDSLYLEYERYVTTLQTDCEHISRCEPSNDAGYDICIDSAYVPTQPCLVYSFGSHFHFGFENDVYRRYNCEIHTFDPSMPIAGHRIPEEGLGHS